MKCTQCGKEWKQMEDIHLPCCPRCTKLHQALKSLIKAKGETILGTSQFRGYIADLASRTETHHKRILRQALIDNLDKKLWEIVKENGAGLEIDSLKYNFKTINGYSDASDYVVDSFLYAFGRISEDKIGVQQAKKFSKTIKRAKKSFIRPIVIVGLIAVLLTAACTNSAKYEDKSIGLVHTLVGEGSQGRSSIVESASYSPDGKYIVSGSHDKTIKVWNSRTGALLLHILKGHGSGIASVSYSPDGQYILSGSSDKTIKVWDIGLLLSQ